MDGIARGNETPHAVMTSPSASMFGQNVVGHELRQDLPVDGAKPVPVDVSDWVMQAGPRLWVVTESLERASIGAPAADLSGLTVTSSNIDPATAGSGGCDCESLTDVSQAESMEATGPALRYPSWWYGAGEGDGICSATSYWNSYPAYQLGSASWLGMPACGPEPILTGNTNCVYPASGGSCANAFPGWQCSELSSRFLYLAYRVEAGGPGDKLALNAQADSNGTLNYITNGTVGDLPEPGDVVSESNSGDGHTYVITGVSPDATAGYATVSIIEQNSSVGGVRTERVKDWVLEDDYTGFTVEGWAQPVANPYALQLTAETSPSTIALSWNSNLTNASYYTLTKESISGMAGVPVTLDE
ncbi:MAG: CHAP domain-containing protein, partial [Candidatus Dormibacteria bacterium]